MTHVKNKHSARVLPSNSLSTPDLHVSVFELPLCVYQLPLFGFQALLQRLHLPRHLLLVLSDGHFQLAQLRTRQTTRGKTKKKMRASKTLKKKRNGYKTILHTHSTYCIQIKYSANSMKYSGKCVLYQICSLLELPLSFLQCTVHI